MVFFCSEDPSQPLPLRVLTLFQHIHCVGDILIVHDRVAMKHRSCFPTSDLHSDFLRDAPAAHVPGSGAAQVVELEPSRRAAAFFGELVSADSR